MTADDDKMGWEQRQARLCDVRVVQDAGSGATTKASKQGKGQE